MLIDILNNIAGYCCLKKQIDIHNIDKYTSNNIFIYKLSIKQNDKFTENILRQHKYSKLIIFLCPNNKNISNINHLKNTLIELDCSGKDNGIGQDGISELKFLKILDCSFNTKINDIGHMAESLEELYCDSDYKKISQISQKDIGKLKKLKILSCENNREIYDVNNLNHSLEKLYCRGTYCGINQGGISKLKNLKLLDCHSNKKIIDVNIFKDSLVELYCGGRCGVKQENIDDLVNLKILDCTCNSYINNVDNFFLEKISYEYSGIDTKKFRLNNIKKLIWHRKIYD